MRSVAFLVAVLFSVQIAFGLGISPAKMGFTQGYDDVEFEFRIIGTDRPVLVRIEGQMAQYIEIDNEIVQPGESITGRILPLPDIAPGTYGNRIIARELSGNAAGTVSATAEVAAQLLVNIPRPDAYLIGTWDYENEGDTMRFTVMLENLGTLEATPDDMSISIGDEMILLNPPAVLPASIEKVTVRHTPSLQPGVYDAVLHVAHEDREFEDRKTVVIGSPIIIIDEFVYRAEEKGVVKPLDVAGSIRWNRQEALRIAVFADNGTAPIAETVVDVQGDFAERLYLEDREPDVLRAVVTARDARAESVWVRTDVDVPSGRWIWIAALALVILGLVWLWRLREK